MVGDRRHEDSFREFVGTHQRRLLRSTWLLTGDWPAAEDLVQSSLVKVWPRWSGVVANGREEALAMLRRNPVLHGLLEGAKHV